MDSVEIGDKKLDEYSMGMGKVNLIAFAMMMPILVILLLPFLLIWDYETLIMGKDAFMDYLLLIFLGGIIVHELLHGLTWAYFTSKGLKSIKFGVKWKFLTPYCHGHYSFNHRMGHW